MIEKQEIHCHNCNRYVHFEIDTSLDGNHVLNCPQCSHEHCRVIKNGIITGERWDSRNGDTFYITSSTSSNTSIYYTMAGSTATSTTGSVYLAHSWLNTTIGWS